MIKNSQNPEWNHKIKLIIPVNKGPSSVSIEVFDHDNLGKDKSLGKLELDLDDLADMCANKYLKLMADADGDQGKWFPLKGVKSGQILLSADILGKARVRVIKAKDLINADLDKFSEPYAMIKYGGQKFKTPTVKNSQVPKWDFEMEFNFPDGEDDSIRIEVLDEDNWGRDESLGRLNLPLSDLATMDPNSGHWFPLEGVESGQILISGDITEALGGALGEELGEALGQALADDNVGEGLRGRPSMSGKDGAPYSTDDGI